MKTWTFTILTLITWFTLTSFQNAQTLTGQWSLVCIRNNETNTESYRPSEYSIDQLNFTFKDNGTSGKISGRTTSNNVSGKYKIENNQLTVKSFGGTKVGEQGWGADFWVNIRSSNSYHYRQDSLVIGYENDTKEMLFISLINDNPHRKP
jgi:heat shock protein HslJ